MQLGGGEKFRVRALGVAECKRQTSKFEMRLRGQGMIAASLIAEQAQR